MKELWDRLGRVRASRLRVEEGGTTREGSGLVTIDRPDPFVIEWEERGSWRNEEGRETPYHDRLRWTLHAPAGVVSLHHLRQGEARPVHLADLRADGEDRFVPLLPHLCASDTYLADLHALAEGVRITWRVSGPTKSYSLVREYR
ncbi:MAG TPA: DUF6314 family protein [Gemmatimonadales bacterium]|nr:DUF6314 family protein [Gemmatimonadales bacterium]